MMRAITHNTITFTMIARMIDTQITLATDSHKEDFLFFGVGSSLMILSFKN